MRYCPSNRIMHARQQTGDKEKPEAKRSMEQLHISVSAQSRQQSTELPTWQPAAVHQWQPSKCCNIVDADSCLGSSIHLLQPTAGSMLSAPHCTSSCMKPTTGSKGKPMTVSNHFSTTVIHKVSSFFQRGSNASEPTHCNSWASLCEITTYTDGSPDTTHAEWL